ncbi:iron-sulfur cluster biosynthesis family protein [Bacillus solimangrovi]|uniref:Core domain-containing protein n=1 Tax=Bacillus solimangrovi TaxID=1305675 RepID=A0A1E5LKI3_9BACI|nr:iron-sulfur cluster biosynthesis family protein [Bacillus solimangrovi]OEH94546.1 hypothetical protein BFG57_07715 [Bacillus solimangrovi]
MKVHFTELAKDQLDSYYNEHQQQAGLQLLYDTDGCGCSVDGVFILTIQDEQEHVDMELSSNYRPVGIESRHAVFLDEEMTVDFLPKYQTFMLKSDQQIINPRMRFVSRRENDGEET